MTELNFTADALAGERLELTGPAGPSLFAVKAAYANRAIEFELRADDIVAALRGGEEQARRIFARAGLGSLDLWMSARYGGRISIKPKKEAK